MCAWGGYLSPSLLSSAKRIPQPPGVPDSEEHRAFSVLQKMSNLRHGMAYSAEWRIWSKMKDRCANPRNNRYQYYGARGINVCRRWLECFENFLADMGPRPSSDHTIERSDVRRGYEPGNCVWIHKDRQAANTTKTQHITVNGVTKALPDWCKSTGLKSSTVHMRISKYGWDPVLAVTTPARRKDKANGVNNIIQ